MTRSDIERDIRKCFGKVGALSPKQFREYSGFSRDGAREFLNGLTSWGNTGGKRFAVVDIAEKMAKTKNKERKPADE